VIEINVEYRVYLRMINSANFKNLIQSWATQIGLRAKFLLKSHVEGQSIDFYYSFSCLFCEIAIFRAFRRAALKSLKGRRLPMADSNKSK
jgi:hypothetical protein